jgi:hypothetical protein
MIILFIMALTGFLVIQSFFFVHKIVILICGLFLSNKFSNFMLRKTANQTPHLQTSAHFRSRVIEHRPIVRLPVIEGH